MALLTYAGERDETQQEGALLMVVLEAKSWRRRGEVVEKLEILLLSPFEGSRAARVVARTSHARP